MLVVNLHRLAATLASRNTLMFWRHKAAIGIKVFANGQELNLEFNLVPLIANLLHPRVTN